MKDAIIEAVLEGRDFELLGTQYAAFARFNYQMRQMGVSMSKALEVVHGKWGRSL